MLTYHHLLPSPAPGLESQLAPGYEADSERIEWGIVPVSPAGTRGNFPRMCEAGGMKVHRLGSAAYYTAVALHPIHDETSCVQPTVTGGDTENGHFGI